MRAGSTILDQLTDSSSRPDMTEDESPPGMKRAAAGIILTLIGGICGSAVFFYVLYRLIIAFRGGRHR
jgi:hypothetical protein